jgi:hypothetical protein
MSSDLSLNAGFQRFDRLKKSAVKRASFAGFQDLAFGKISLAKIAGMGDPKRENNTRLSTSRAGMSA